MRNVFIWENPIDWSYIIPIAKHLEGENFFIYKFHSDKYLIGMEEIKPDNILVFRYGTMNLIKDLPAKKYQFYHGLIDKGFKYGQIWESKMYYDYFIEAGEWGKNMMIERGHVPEDKVISLGYPKLDMYSYYKEKKEETLLELGLPHLSKTIFYAPTCREQSSAFNYLDKTDFQGEVLGEHIDKIIPKDTNLIIKLHDASRTIEDRIKELNNRQIVFVNDYNSLKYMAVSDIVLSDCSSIMLEAMACDIPVIQYINNEKNFIKDTCDLWDYTEKVQNIDGIHEAIEKYTDPNYKKPERDKYREMMFNNLFNSGKIVADFIKEQCDV